MRSDRAVLSAQLAISENPAICQNRLRLRALRAAVNTSQRLMRRTSSGGENSAL